MFFKDKMKFLSFTVTVSALLISSVKTDDDDDVSNKMKHYEFYKWNSSMEESFYQILESTKEEPEICRFDKRKISDICKAVTKGINHSQSETEETEYYQSETEENGYYVDHCEDRLTFRCKAKEWCDHSFSISLRQCKNFYIMAFDDNQIYILSTDKDKLLRQHSGFIYLYGLAKL